MHLHLVAVGKRMPDWVTAGYNEYNTRLPHKLRVNLIEVSPVDRAKSTTTQKILAEEARRIRTAVPERSCIVILDERGKQLDSLSFSKKLKLWTQSGRDVTFIIGGADGLAEDLKIYSDMLWSLSSMTLPHAMARVILVEQVYRAWTILQKHPYHRE